MCASFFWVQREVLHDRNLGLHSTTHHLPYCCCSVTKSCLTLCYPMNCSTPGFPVPHHLPEFAQTHIHLVGDAIQPSHPLMPHSTPVLSFPSIKVFSNESVLPIKWPKYWSFSFSISPFIGNSELISFRIDQFDLAVQWTPLYPQAFLNTVLLFLSCLRKLLTALLTQHSNLGEEKETESLPPLGSEVAPNSARMKCSELARLLHRLSNGQEQGLFGDICKTLL